MIRDIRRRLSAPSVQVVFASLTGLALRIYFAVRLPSDAGDSGIYQELARNWIDAHIYGLDYGSGIIPSDMRSPGYPAFVALLYLFIRRDQRAILLAQAALDLATCFLVAGLAYRLAPEPDRRRIGLAALWLAVTCPLVASYAAVPLPEVLATFCTAAALIPLAMGCASLGPRLPADRAAAPAGAWLPWFLGGLLVGVGTLVRPETPLLLAALALVLAVRWRHSCDWARLFRVGALTAMGLALPLLPWGARNWSSLHEVQLLAPRYAASPDEYTPRGLYAWTATWLVRFRDVYLVPWNIGSVPVSIQDVSPAAFDSPAERARVAVLLDRYNTTLRMTPEVDSGFAELARERTARHPLRTYVWVPAGRVLTLWFTPRVELLPVSGHLFPVRLQWQQDAADFEITSLFAALNVFYVGLACIGLRRALRQFRARGAGALPLILFVVFVLVRTAFLTQVETPEPRYVLECFPVILALGAFAWLPASG